MSMPRVVILGGGFAGVKCARVLRRTLRGGIADVVLFDRENHLVFSPLLGDVVGSSLSPLDVVVPVRAALPGVYCRTEEVQHIDLEANEVEFEAAGGRRARLRYDHLVIACGNVPNLQVVPGMADHAFPLKSIGDALALRQHVIERMEKAEVEEDSQQRRWYLSFLVVGAGYTGVEVAGEINDLVRGSARHYRNFRAEDVSVTLIHSTDQILPELSPKLREVARKQMERAGVSMLPQARVVVATNDGVGLGDGRFVRGGTIVSTIGSSTAPVIERLAVEK
jgi:NADH dehydrogenase